MKNLIKPKILYVTKNIDNNLVRVGSTRELDRRLAEINMKSPEDLIAQYETEYGKLIEKVMKYHFKDKTKNNTPFSERFNMDVDSVIDFIESTLRQIKLEPDHAPRWLEKYVSAKRNGTKAHSELWY